MISEDPDSKEYKKGYAIGKRAGRNPFLRLLFHPLFKIYLHFASRVFREFRVAYPSSKMVAFVVYSEPHQHEYLFGDSGILRGYEWNILSVDYRKDLLNQWAKKQDWVIVKILNNLQVTLKDMPLGIVFTTTGLSSIHRFSKQYKKRRKDKGAEINNCLHRFVDEIDAHLNAQKRVDEL